ncbi:major facilitator superfamily domain-containing protein [Mycena olivaceomarginata]|nr:major facilitator superfamily domain-containing protein [Mycena olivaceomarginata]
MPEPTERDPLIPRAVVQANAHAEPDVKRRLGPLEISASNRRGILIGIWLANFLGVLMPSISSEFQKFHQASWLGTAYLLATCTFTPLYGRLCNSLIFARFAVAAYFTTSSIIVSDMYTLRNRGLIQGWASCFSGLGMGLGGPFGGVITDLLGWRAAFLLQMPVFLTAFLLTQYNIRYVTPGKSKSTKEVLKRIDYFGSLTLLVSVGSLLVFLSTRYNESLPWSDARVIAPLVLAIVFFIAFLWVEIFVAPEPVMAPAMLRQRIPVLVSISNFLVGACNFSVTYFFPMWFQVVTLESASTSGLHLMPNSVSMSTGSVFAGWVMHRTGRFQDAQSHIGIFPTIGATLISLMREDSGPIQSWLSIIPLGFGNAVVLQTMLIALLANLPESQMAVGTGFGQLFRGIGQVGGVAISSAIFQSRLETELRKRIHTPNAEELIRQIRRNSAFVRTLEPEQQREARDSFSIALKTVYIFAACLTFTAYCVRLPIPDMDLDKAHARQRKPSATEGRMNSTVAPGGEGEPAAVASSSTTPPESDSPIDTDTETSMLKRSMDGTMDLESDEVGGSARVVKPVT